MRPVEYYHRLGKTFNFYLICDIIVLLQAVPTDIFHAEDEIFL